jgi:hypothetical protein
LKLIEKKIANAVLLLPMLIPLPVLVSLGKIIGSERRKG